MFAAVRLLLLVLLFGVPIAAGSDVRISDDLQQILSNYQQHSDWFTASDWLQVQVEQRQLDVPVFAWITNLVPPRLRGANLYQVCRDCFLLGAAADSRAYLHEHEAWWQHQLEYLQKMQRFTRLAWWRTAMHRAHGFLQRLYHERGVVSAALVGLTWLPYTAITEGVIEPMLIGPLHTICPLFQVAYFGTLNFTHTFYKNMQHSMSFADGELTRLSRFRLALSGWQSFSPRRWQIAGRMVDSNSIARGMAAELDDEVLVRLLASPLRPVIAAVLLSPPATGAASPRGNAVQLYRELTHPDRLRRLYFVEMTIAVARLLIDLSDKHYELRLENGELPARRYRELQGQLGVLQRSLFMLELHLKKLIVISQVLEASSGDAVLVDFQRPAQLTQQALHALLASLQHIFHNLHNQSNDNAATELFVRRVAEFDQYDFIFNTIAATRK